jgi:8-oxo-dGTP pyrophosphatase MutT (NUDIX family)
MPIIKTGVTKEEMLPLHVVGCLVRIEAKILLLKRQVGKRHANFWGLPAGKVDTGETASAAMVRELFEETGLVCQESDLKLEEIFNVDQGDQQFTYTYFSLDIFEYPEVILSKEEHSNSMLFSPQKAQKLPLVPGELECMTIVLKNNPLYYGIAL